MEIEGFLLYASVELEYIFILFKGPFAYSV